MSRNRTMPMMMRQTTDRLRSTKFLLPKSGHSLSECEDAIAIDVVSQRAALADGATEAYDAGNWAGRLVDSWVGSTIKPLPGKPFDDWLNCVSDELHKSWDLSALPWYAEEKARTGSFATFIGLELSATCNGLEWRAIALGDSCIIRMGIDRVTSAGPVFETSQFTSAPILVPSNSESRNSIRDRWFTASGRLEYDEILLLVSDAIACHLMNLTDVSRVRRIITRSLEVVGVEHELEQYLNNEREHARLKDDDIAIAAIRISADS